MLKKLFVFLLVLTLCLPSTIYAAAQQPIRVYVDGNKIQFDIDPIQEKGTTLVQFRPVFEALGLSVSWNKDTNTVTGTKEDLNLELKLNSTTAYINGEKKELNIAPRTKNGNTLVPLRFIGEATGKNVSWDEKSRIIQIGIEVAVVDSEKETPSNPDKYTFRSTTWGMTKSDLKKSENLTLHRDEQDVLIYKGAEVSGLKAVIAYEIVKNKLVRAAYMIDNDYVNSNKGLLNYKKLKKALTEKYGSPILDEEIWINDLFQDEPKSYDLAVSIGHLSYLAKWETEDTHIFLLYSGSNYTSRLGIIYSSVKLNDLLEQKDSEKNLQGL